MKKHNYNKPDFTLEILKLDDTILSSTGTGINVGELVGEEAKDIIDW